MTITGNRLPDILRRIAAMRGPAALTEPEIITSLDRTGTFSGQPSLRFIMRAAIESGTVRRFIAVGEWDRQARGVIDHFITVTGFQPAPVNIVFRSIAVALDIASPDILSLAPTDYSPTNPSERDPTPGRPKAWDNRWTNEEKLTHISSMIEIDRERDVYTGIRAANASCIRIDQHSVTLTFETERKRPLATGALMYSVHSPQGDIIDTGAAAIICYNDTSRRAHSLTLKTSPDRISAIRLFWD